VMKVKRTHVILGISVDEVFVVETRTILISGVRNHLAILNYPDPVIRLRVFGRIVNCKRPRNLGEFRMSPDNQYVLITGGRRGEALDAGRYAFVLGSAAWPVDGQPEFLTQRHHSVVGSLAIVGSLGTLSYDMPDLVFRVGSEDVLQAFCTLFAFECKAWAAVRRLLAVSDEVDWIVISTSHKECRECDEER